MRSCETRRAADARKTPAILAVLAAALLATAGASAASIWAGGGRRSAYLYSDNLAARVGDSLTVVISDATEFEWDDQRELEKITSHSGSMNIDVLGPHLEIAPGDLTQDSERKFEGTNKYDSTRTFQDRITVTVVDELPNENLVIAGRATRIVAKQETVTIVTGVVRPEDVAADNSVKSTQVAHLCLHYESAGVRESYTDDGWINKITNFLWPF